MASLTIGDKRNKLTVLDTRTFQKTFKTGSIRQIKELFVKCDCGRTKWIRAEHVKGGQSKSCGCLNYELQCKDPRVRTVSRVYSYTRMSAKKRGLTFTLTKAEIDSEIFKNCFYCAGVPSRIIEEPRPYGVPLIPCHGLDRVDANKGYVLDNIVPCCFKCNMMKWDLSITDFLKHIKLLANKSTDIVNALNARLY